MMDGYPINQREYTTCQRRGHFSSGRGLTPGMGPTYTVCEHCGTLYRYTEPELREWNDEQESQQSIARGRPAAPPEAE